MGTRGLLGGGLFAKMISQVGVYLRIYGIFSWFPGLLYLKDLKEKKGDFLAIFKGNLT